MKRLLQTSLFVLTAMALGFLIHLGIRYFFAGAELPERSQMMVSSKPLFAANYPDSDGKPQALQQYQGKPLVVNFWATWCPPCLEEMPELSALHSKYQTQQVGFVGISTDDVAKIAAYARRSPMSYALLAGDMQAMDLSAMLGNSKGALPYTVVIAADGLVKKTYYGRINTRQLEQDILELLAKP